MKNNINKSESVLNYSLKYGIVLAFILFVIHIVNYITHNEIRFINYLNYIAILVIIILAAVNYRNKYLYGFISYGKASVITIITSTSGILLYTVLLFLFLKFYDTVFLDVIQKQAIENLIKNPEINDLIGNYDIDINKLLDESDINNNQIRDIKNAMKIIYTPFLFSLTKFINLVLTSIFFSLIASAFIRKNDNSFDAKFKHYKNEYFNNNSSI